MKETPPVPLAQIEDDALLLLGSVSDVGQKQSLTDQEVRDVVPAIRDDEIKVLRTLKISGFEIDKDAAIEICNLIGQLPGLHTIDLSGTHIGEYLPEVIANITSWVASSLNLSQCNLTIKEVAALARSLDSISCSVMYLNISYNPITCHGLGLLLKWGCGITDLEAKFCGIMSNDKRAGVDILLDGLAENTSCTVLSLHGNNFDSTLMTRIRKAIEENPRSQLSPGNVMFIDRLAPTRIGNIIDYLKREDKKGIEIAGQVSLRATLETALPWPTMIREQADIRVLTDIRRISELDGTRRISDLDASWMSRRSRTSEMGLRDLSLLGGASCATSRSPSFAMSSPRSSPRFSRRSVDVRNDIQLSAARMSPRKSLEIQQRLQRQRMASRVVSIVDPETEVDTTVPQPSTIRTKPKKKTPEYLKGTQSWARRTEPDNNCQNWAKSPKRWPAATPHDGCSSSILITSPLSNPTACSQAKVDDLYEGDVYEKLGKEVKKWPARTPTSPIPTKRHIPSRLTQTTASWRGKHDFVEESGRWVSIPDDVSTDWKKTPTSWPESTSSTPNGLQQPVDSNFDQFTNVHRFSISNEIPTNLDSLTSQKTDRQTPAILNACLSGDQVCTEILGPWAFSGLSHGMGSEFGVPMGILAHNGEPNVLNNLSLGTVERIGGIAKLLHMITSVPLTPIQKEDETYAHIRYLPGIPQHLESESDVVDYVVNLAVSHRDPSFVKLIANPDYEFYRIEENALARRLLRKHKRLERGVNRRGRDAFESSSRSRSVASDVSTVSTRSTRLKTRSRSAPRWDERSSQSIEKWGSRTPEIDIKKHVRQYFARPERQLYRIEQQVMSKNAVWPAPLATVGVHNSPSRGRHRSHSVTLGGNALSPPVAMRSNKADFSSSTQSSIARSAGKITRYPPSFTRSKSYSHR